jgi:hypothetical protein
VPWERARTHSIDNIRLRCRTHNDYAACQAFGDAHMARFRKALAPTGSANQPEGPHDPTRSGTSRGLDVAAAPRFNPAMACQSPQSSGGSPEAR